MIIVYYFLFHTYKGTLAGHKVICKGYITYMYASKSQCSNATWVLNKTLIF